MTDLLDAALAYAARGLRVLPVQPRGKRPLPKDWPTAATTDEATIRAWWGEHPDANVGLATGDAFEVVDEDEPGSLARFTVPVTVEASTPRPGRHLYFARNGHAPLKNSVRRAAGLDVRSVGGFVVAPPSIGANGEAYAWVCAPGEVALAEMPDDLREALTVKPAKRPGPAPRRGADAYAAAALERETAAVRAAPEGQRNATLNTAAFSLGQLIGGNVLDRATVEADLTEAALASGLDAAEVAATIASGLDAGAAQPRSAPEREAAVVAADESIEVRECLAHVTDAAVAALARLNGSGLFVRGGALVRMSRQAAAPADDDAIRRETGTLFIFEAPEAFVRERIDRSARWWKRKYDRSTRQWFEAPALPPSWVVDGVIARGEWPFPHLEGVTTTPLLRPDGSVLDVPGYDPRTGYFFAPSIEYDAVPERPTRADAARAALALCEVVADFPFLADSDRAAALGIRSRFWRGLP